MKKIIRHIIDHGVVALISAVVSLFAMRGFDWKTLILFGFPTCCALVHSRLNSSRVAEAFLISIGVASIVASLPWLFPRLGSLSTQPLDAHNNRLMTLYVGIYLLWLFVILPLHLFGGSLRAKRRGEVASFSTFTCYLGLCTASILWLAGILSLPSALWKVGLWPIM